MTVSLLPSLLENNSMDGWPSLVDMKVIVPGVVHYEDLRGDETGPGSGNVLADKEFLDAIAASLEGKPIINWDHRKVSPEDFKKGKAQGIITTPAIFNGADGWYHAKALVWDEATRRNVENGFSISCAYVVSEWDEGGTHANVPYVKRAKAGEYTHIAVVPVPRYEKARIELMNSKGGVMGLLSLFRKDKPEEKIDVDMSTPVNVEGVGEVTLETLANSFKASEAKRQELLNKGLDDNRFVEIDGKKVTVGDLKKAHIELLNEEASDPIKLEAAHNKGEHKNSVKNCPHCNKNSKDDDEKKKEEERKNAEAEEKKKKDEDERKNAAAKKEADERAAAAKRAEELSNARNRGGKVEMPRIDTLRDLVAEGEARYGATRTAATSK